MTATAEALLEVARTVQVPPEGQSRIRTQAACVRALCDEIARNESAGFPTALREQLQEELTNLAFLLEQVAAPVPSASGIRLRR
jgi:hypothetical protein